MSPTQFSPVTEALFSRLGLADTAAVEGRLDPEDRAYLTRVQGDPVERKRAILHLGAHYKVREILTKTGLRSVTPPESVHSMGRGSLAGGGSLYYGDLVVGALEQVGANLPPGAKILDFGSSSGRVIRVLKAYEASYECYGCDPNQEAITWAQTNLDPIAFAVSPLRPPLDYASRSFDLVFAISIWSHMNQKSSKAWLKEMRRLVQSGGLFILTFHGWNSVNYYEARRLRPPQRIDKTRAALIKKGFHFFNIFGESGDWGVKDGEWGEAYISPGWLEENTRHDWELLYYQAGLVESNQDLAVLRAR